MMIIFSGLDGAGKSTQIVRLKAYFETKNRKVVLFWSRGGYTPGMEFLKQLLRKSGSPVVPSKQGNTKEREIAFQKNSVRKLWLILAVFDLILHYGLILRFKNISGKQIICDRYIFDTQLDFELNFPDEKVSTWFLWKILKKVALLPKYYFVLTIPVEESQKRSKLKNEPFPDSLEVLNYRLAKYLDFCKNHKNVHHIECNKPIEAVQQEILSYIK